MESRLNKLRELISEQNIDAVLISSSPNIQYLTGYAGFVPDDRDAYILITKTHAYIFTHALYAEAMGTEIPHMDLVEITRDEPFPRAMQRLMKEHAIQTLGFEADNLSFEEYTKLSPLKIALKEAKLSHLRTIKEPIELTKLKLACQLSDNAFEYILDYMKPGITEKEISYAFNKYFTNHDAESAFRAIVAFGKNASVPHHLSGETKLKARDAVLSDFGAKVHSYCADISRTFFLGKPTSEEKKMYQIAYDSQQKAIEFIENKLDKSEAISAPVLDKVARDYIASKGYPPFPYSLGHGIGLEVHDFPRINPRSKDTLENGMVFTLEPGIHLPGVFGVRIEDVFTIQDNKLEKLTHSKNTLIIL